MKIRFAVALSALLALPAATALAQNAATLPGKQYMDTTCKPCDDFYKYANGAWLDTAVMPPSYSSMGAGRDLFDRNQEALRRVLERSAKAIATEKNPTLKKLGILYSQLADSTRLDRMGASGLKSGLARIDAIKTEGDLTGAFAYFAIRGGGLGQLASPGFGMPFYFDPQPDPDDSRYVLGRIQQGGLGLQDRDLYFRSDAKSDTLRMHYVQHLAKTFELLGDDTQKAAGEADAVMKLELALADSSMSRVAQRDPHAIVHKMTTRELSALCPGVDWPAYFTAVGSPATSKSDSRLNVAMPNFMIGLNALLQSASLETWRNYLRVHYALRNQNWLGKAFADEAFHFNSQLTGQKAQQPQWKKAATQVDDAMGDALGQAYVQTEFPPSSKARVKEMVDNLQAALKERIASRPWMSEETKKQAIVKLDAMMKKIGYPDKWRDYTPLEIDPELTAVENLARCEQFKMSFVMAQVGKPVDRTIWGLTAPTVNAYYEPTTNEILFPAGILQPPYFDPKADDASNYGAVGMVIGHEITHGFDDEGRQFDSVGNLHNWWTDDDAKKFEVAAQRVVDQFNGYVAVDTLHVNGKLTLGENLADFGGLTVALEAYHRSLKGKAAPVIDGYTGDQRFFLAHAHAWRSMIRPELVRLIVLTNEHSPARFRVNGPLSNMPEFRAAFHCQSGDAMVRPDSERPEIW
jgi:putative endopeptidase